MKSLKAQDHQLAHAEDQIDILEHGTAGKPYVPVPFYEKLRDVNLFPLKPLQLDILQINVGKMCNQVCRHCHVDAGPDRKEIMTRETMQHCLDALREVPTLKTVDLTGGAPEMNPHFRWFVEEIKRQAPAVQIIVRCNLTIIRANKKYYDLPEFYRDHGIEVVSSLPFYKKDRTDKQRGDGVFESSIEALRMLNRVGYGIDLALKLNLVYNPAGAFLPGSQEALEKEFKQQLFKDFGIQFNQLFTITNMPISRYLQYLLESGNYEKYMEKLVSAFNPAAAENVMCRNTISVGWDGYLYDCDFNQMLEMKVDSPGTHISAFRASDLLEREIRINQHCYGCTAGAGSSCGGTVA